MNNPSLALADLELQMSILEDDKRKTSEKMFQIMGAMKVIEFLIHKVKTDGISEVEEGVNHG